MPRPVAIIVGAGPAGLTAAYELLDHTEVKPVVLEMSAYLGGISRTAVYKGNRFDIGGHRFFSRSQRVMRWWLNVLPPQGAPALDDRLLGRRVEVAGTVTQRPLGTGQTVTRPAPDPDREDTVMLRRDRVSRILHGGQFFDYPLSLNSRTLTDLGLGRSARIGLSYARARVRPIRRERSLEDFLVNRFGRELYATFFRDYTEKVWGISCREIPAAWGAQRIKGISINKAIGHALRRRLRPDETPDARDVEPSLIDSFLYPKYGPGQMWEEVARQVGEAGGEVLTHREVVGVQVDGGRVTGVTIRNARTGRTSRRRAAHVISTMPIRHLIRAMGSDPPDEVRKVAEGLVYRDFVTVGLLLRRLKIRNETSIRTMNDLPPDNWIYVQERGVKLGRLQIFNNWSPYLVADPERTWVGLEYFCNVGDELWSKPEDEFARFAVRELASIGIVDPGDVLDQVVLKVPKTYPAYFGTYDRLDIVRRYLDRLSNLTLIGRNGLHRYNNQDHSMMTAMVAVENIAAGVTDNDNVWSVNTDAEYHEER